MTWDSLSLADLVNQASVNINAYLHDLVWVIILNNIQNIILGLKTLKHFVEVLTLDTSIHEFVFFSVTFHNTA